MTSLYSDNGSKRTPRDQAGGLPYERGGDARRLAYASGNSSCAQRPPPSPPLGCCGAFARLVSPGGQAFANFVLPGGRAFANPSAIRELLTSKRFPLSI